jgi:hypothetical protein
MKLLSWRISYYRYKPGEKFFCDEITASVKARSNREAQLAFGARLVPDGELHQIARVEWTGFAEDATPEEIRYLEITGPP